MTFIYHKISNLILLFKLRVKNIDFNELNK